MDSFSVSEKVFLSSPGLFSFFAGYRSAIFWQDVEFHKRGLKGTDDKLVKAYLVLFIKWVIV